MTKIISMMEIMILIDKSSSNKVKRHGFTPPLNFQQIGAWCAAAILVLSYFLVIMPGNYFIHVSFVIIFWLIYSWIVAFLLYFCLRTTWSDPTDPNVKYEQECRKQGIEPVENQELEFLWDVWEAFVLERTKHWGDWNRWVDLFDHHWKWLNNCIGGANYRLFIGLIVVLFIKNIVFMINALIFMFVLIIDEAKFQEGFEEYYGTQPSRWALFIYVLFLI